MANSRRRNPISEEEPELSDARSLVDRGEELLAIGDHEALARLIDDNWVTTLTTIPVQLDAWIGALPRELLDTHPRFEVARDVLFRFHDRTRIPAMVRRPSGRALLASDGSNLRDVISVGLGQSFALRATGEFARARELVLADSGLIAGHRAAWLTLPGGERCIVHLQWGLTRFLAQDFDGALDDFREAYWAGRQTESDFLARDAAGKAALILALCDDLTAAGEWLDRAAALPAAPEYMQHFIEDWEELARGFIALGRLDLEAAQAALDRYRPASMVDWAFGITQYLLAMIRMLSGRRVGALDALDRARNPVPTSFPGSLDEAFIALAGAHLALALGQGPRARAYLERAAPSPLLATGWARLALLEGQPLESLTIAISGLHAPQSFGRLDLRGIQSLALLRLDRHPEAAEMLRAMFELIRGTGALTPVALMPRRRLAEIADLVPEHRDLVDRVLATGVDSFQEVITVIELSQREREVLVALARTSSAQSIAAELFVSVNTVKTQLRSLYRKLGAHSREEALLLAHRHGFDLSAGG